MGLRVAEPYGDEDSRGKRMMDLGMAFRNEEKVGNQVYREISGKQFQYFMLQTIRSMAVLELCFGGIICLFFIEVKLTQN